VNTSGISPSFLGLSRSSGQVTHVLLTRSRLCPRASPGSSLHLHVLSTPPAFVLSQDQTLREELLPAKRPASRKAVMSHNEATEYTVAASTHDAGYFSTFGSHRLAGEPTESDLFGSSASVRPKKRMLLSFQRPAASWGSAGIPRIRRRAGRNCSPAGTEKDSSLSRATQAMSPRRQPRGAYERTWTVTWRSRGRSSKSSRTICC